MIVLHAFSPKTPAVRQQKTWLLLELLRRHGRHAVLDWPCHGDGDYSAALELLWGVDDIWLIEHDLVPDLETAAAFESCPEPICTQAYEMHGSEDGPVFGFRVLEDDALRWGREGEQWADLFPLGCTRIRRSVMERTPVDVFAGAPWTELDHRLSISLRAAWGRSHVHWPAIPHVHH